MPEGHRAVAECRCDWAPYGAACPENQKSGVPPELDRARLSSGSIFSVWASCSRSPGIPSVLSSALQLLNLAQLNGEEMCKVIHEVRCAR